MYNLKMKKVLVEDQAIPLPALHAERIEDNVPILGLYGGSIIENY